jgi:hypothetical protein
MLILYSHFNTRAIPVMLILFYSTIGFGQTDKKEHKDTSAITVGFEIDALPFLMKGYYGSVWVGLNKQNLRLRPVYAKSNIPDFMLEEDIKRNTVNAFAFIADYFFKDNFEGIWIGTGFEYWDNEIENNMGVSATYESWVYTLGGGYVWKFWGYMYLNPWIAGHIRTGGDSEISIGDAIYKPLSFTPEISLKLGWHF